MIKILQWNGESIISYKGSLEKYIFDSNIKIALLTETWFKKNSVVNFSGFNRFRQDREDGNAGVAILVDNSHQTSPIINNYKIKQLMCSAIQIKFQNNTIIM